MVNPFSTQNPFESQNQSFLQRLERERLQRRANMLGAAQARQRVQKEQQEEQQKLAEQALVQQYARTMQPPQVQPGQEYVPGPTPSPPAIVKGIDVRPEDEREEPFNFKGGFAPGIRSNIANAAITALGAIEPAYNTAVGVGARLLPGDQEFDKQFRNVMEERVEQGKGAGIRQFFAAGTEAARRAQPMQQGAEIFSSWAVPWLDILGNVGIPQETLDQFQELREQYFEEETGETWDDTGFFRNFTADIRASRRAYKDIDLPKYYKGTMEIALDPLNLLPGAGWVNDAKAVTKVAKLSAQGAVNLPRALINSPKTAVSAKVRILETWRAANEVPAEELTLDAIKAKADAGKEIIDNTDIGVLQRQFQQESLAGSARAAARRTAIAEQKTGQATITKELAGIENKRKILASERKTLFDRKKELRKRTDDAAIRERSTIQKRIDANNKEKAELFEKQDALTSQWNAIDDVIKRLEEEAEAASKIKIRTGAEIKEVAEAQMGERTTPQVAGAFDYIEPIIIGNRADDRTAQSSRFFDDADSTTDAQRRIDTSDELNELAEANLRSGQNDAITIGKEAAAVDPNDMNVAQKLGYRIGQLGVKAVGETVASRLPSGVSPQTVSVQGAFREMYYKLPEAIQMPFTGVINAITPRLIAKLDEVDLNTERIKSALINANLQNRAAVVVNQIQAVTGSAKQVFGETIENAIIDLNKLDPTGKTGNAVKNALKKRYGTVVEGSENLRFHESDLINAVVEVAEVRLANGSSTIVYDIAANFKKADSPFFQNGQITRQGNYLIQRAKAYGEFAKLLDESGIPIGVTADGAEIMLRGAARITQLMTDGAFASRFVWSKSNGALRGTDGAFDKYYNKARTLLDPDELLAAVDSGRVAYATPEDTLSVYASGVYKQIADAALEERLIKLFSDSSNGLAEKYGVTVVKDLKNVLDSSGTSKEFRSIAGLGETGGRKTKEVGYFLKDKKVTRVTDETTPSERQRLFDSLLFTDDKAAARFAKDFDVLLESEQGFFGLLKHQMLTNRVARTAADISRIFRLAGTGIDVGLLAIYGPVVMGKASVDILKGLKTGNANLVQQGKALHKALADATIDSFISLVRPDQVQARLYAPSRRDTLRKMNLAGVTLSRPTVEAYEAVNAGGPVTQWMTKPGKPVDWLRGTGLHQTLKRFEGAWSTFIDEVKISSFEAMTKHLDATTDADEILRIGDFINKSTGTLSSEAAGLSKFQRQIETTFMFFSPRMTRSMIALMSDGMTRGGVSGNAAREGVIGAWFGLQAYTWAVGQALGQDVNLDPTEPHYLQIKIGNDWVGPSSQMVSLPRAAYRAIAGPDDVDAIYKDFNEDGGYKDNEWFRLLRGRAFSAPAGSVVMDAITNEDYFGQPYDNAKSLATAQARKALPFWMQDVVVGDPYRIGWATVGAEFAGLRTRALTPYERRRQLRDQAVSEKFSKAGFTNYESLDPKRKRELFAELEAGVSSDVSDSVLRDFTTVNELIDRRRELNQVETTSVDEFYDVLDEINVAKDARKQEALRNFELLEGQTPGDFRAQLNDINTDYSPRYEELYDKTADGKYADVHAFMERLDNVGGTERQEDVWISTFLEEVLYNPEFEKVTEFGIEYHDFDGKSDAERAWLDRFGANAYNYVQDYLRAGKDLHPIEQELIQAREKYGFYWEAPKLAAIENTALSLGKSTAEIEEEYKQWNSGTVQQKEILGKSEVIKSIRRFVDKTRKALRENDQGLDGFLYRFAYTTTLAHPANEDIGSGFYWRSKQIFDEEIYNQFSPQQETGVK